MLDLLLEPLQYDYMLRAMWVSALVGGTCALMSAYLILKGWSLIGDALSHSVVPGVAGAYILALPFAYGAFSTALLAALAIAYIRHKTRIRDDAIIGFVFSLFFALGLFLVSVFPVSIKVQSIVLGNMLAISDQDVIQVVIMCGITLLVIALNWRSLMAIFFDEGHARSIGLPVTVLKIVFFVLLSACTVAALQTVGAILVIAMVITPGATAYLLTERFSHVMLLSALIGALTSVFGAWSSYLINASMGGIIVCLQTSVFLLAFLFSPSHGLFFRRKNQSSELAQ